MTFAALAALALVPASGEDLPRVELFGGYSYMHHMPTNGSVSLNGWKAGLKLNVTPRVGLLSDVGGNYGEAQAVYGAAFTFVSSSGAVLQERVTLYPEPPNIRKYSLLFGPEFRLARRARLAFSARALAGVAHGTLDAPVYFISSLFPPASLALPTKTSFAASFGGSVDVRLTDHMSYRLIQPELVLTRLGYSGTERNLRLSTGLVFRFSK